MTDFFLYIFIFVLGYIIGYSRGVVSGYNTKIREEDKPDIFNVHIIFDNGVYYFFDHSKMKFLLQDIDETVGLNRVKEMLPEHIQRFVILRTDGKDEPI